jgi:chemotaxis protein CheC
MKSSNTQSLTLLTAIGTEKKLVDIFQACLQNSARGLSEMVGRRIDIHLPKIEEIPIGHVIDRVGGPETEMVGIYLLIDGDVSGQTILMLSLTEALFLVDLLLGEPPGTTTHLGDLERSALAETGNLTAAFFLNEIDALTGISLRPSPPAVIVDMLGAIIDVITAPIAVISDKLSIVETVFEDDGRTVLAHFWILPFPASALA